MILRKIASTASRAANARMFLAVAAVAVVAVGVRGATRSESAVAQAAQPAGACTNASLTGNYAFLLSGGPLVAANGAPLSAPEPQVVLEVLVYDGAGKFTADDYANRNGELDQESISGTYSINSDCTYSQIEYTNDGTAYHSSGVIDNGGSEFRFVDTDPGAVFSATGHRYTASGCSNASLNGKYGGSSNGWVVASLEGVAYTPPLPWAQIAQYTYDGNGGIREDSTSSTGSGGQSVAASGTYTVNADCVGAETYARSDGRIAKTALVVVDSGRTIYYVTMEAANVETGSRARQ